MRGRLRRHECRGGRGDVETRPRPDHVVAGQLRLDRNLNGNILNQLTLVPPGGNILMHDWMGMFFYVHAVPWTKTLKPRS